MSHLATRILKSQFELFEESCLHLRNSFSDFEKQIKSKAVGCLDSSSGTTMTDRDVIAMLTAAQNSLLEHEDVLTAFSKTYPPNEMSRDKTTPELRTEAECTSDDHVSVKVNSDIIGRLEYLETTLTSLQDAQQQSEDALSEIKQWKDNSGTEIKIEHLSKKQKQNFKNFRKQMNEQEKKIDELNKVIENFKEKDLLSNKTLEKLTLEMKKYENNCFTVSKEIEAYTDQTNKLTQKLKTTGITSDNLSSKFAVICKLLQQRSQPFDKLLHLLHQTTENRKESTKKIETLEKDVLKLSHDLVSKANQPEKHSTMGFMASDGQVNDLYGEILYKRLDRNIGNNFDQNNGRFTSPVDGLYIVSLRIKQTGDQSVLAGVTHTSGDQLTLPGTVLTNGTNDDQTGTFVTWMKTSDQLYSWANCINCEITHFSSFLLGV